MNREQFGLLVRVIVGVVALVGMFLVDDRWIRALLGGLIMLLMG